jgi:RNA recognition motif-containing protein
VVPRRPFLRLVVFFFGFKFWARGLILPELCVGHPRVKNCNAKVSGRPKKMSKLYIGNLAAEANEAALRQLLQESGVGNVSSVLVKRGGYAFIDCPEQSTVDRAIEKLNGKFYIFHIIFLFSFDFQFNPKFASPRW